MHTHQRQNSRTAALNTYISKDSITRTCISIEHQTYVVFNIYTQRKTAFRLNLGGKTEQKYHQPITHEFKYRITNMQGSNFNSRILVKIT